MVSKTDFLIWRDCRHNAWLKLHAPDIYHGKPLSAFEQTIIETGNEVDLLARQLFPGGVEITHGDVAGTATHIAQRTPVLYQPVFKIGELLIVCDILAWNGERYDLYEVKASTSGEEKAAKDDLYAHDLGFQAYVLKALDVPLGRLSLVRLDSSYVRNGVLDLDSLFTREDFTDRVNALLPEIAEQLVQCQADLASIDPLPSPCGCIRKGRNSHCSTFAHTNPTVPAYSVHDIARIGASKRKLGELIDRGILAIADVPDDIELSPIQRAQVDAAKSKQPTVDTAAIHAFLTTCTKPVAFLDYETFAAALPRFDGYRPFDQIPFQFSLDVLDDAGLRHHEFLWTESTCPDAAFIAALDLALPVQGAVIVWNKGFECSINRRLATRNPQAQAILDAINSRVVDLEDVFKQQHYVHPDFKGKTSIKNVLPVLVPQLSYKALAIQEGATASDTWNQIVTGKLTSITIDERRQDLLTYCALDTYAMVAIWRQLGRLWEQRLAA